MTSVVYAFQQPFLVNFNQLALRLRVIGVSQPSLGLGDGEEEMPVERVEHLAVKLPQAVEEGQGASVPMFHGACLLLF